MCCCYVYCHQLDLTVVPQTFPTRLCFDPASAAAEPERFDDDLARAGGIARHDLIVDFAREFFGQRDADFANGAHHASPVLVGRSNTTACSAPQPSASTCSARSSQRSSASSFSARAFSIDRKSVV